MSVRAPARPARRRSVHRPRDAHLAHEYELRRAGFRRIAGLDEVGRGSLAGPVVAAAVILPRPSPHQRPARQQGPPAQPARGAVRADRGSRRRIRCRLCRGGGHRSDQHPAGHQARHARGARPPPGAAGPPAHRRPDHPRGGLPPAGDHRRRRHLVVHRRRIDRGQGDAGPDLRRDGRSASRATASRGTRDMGRAATMPPLCARDPAIGTAARSPPSGCCWRGPSSRSISSSSTTRSSTTTPSSPSKTDRGRPAPHAGSGRRASGRHMAGRARLGDPRAPSSVARRRDRPGGPRRPPMPGRGRGPAAPLGPYGERGGIGQPATPPASARRPDGLRARVIGPRMPGRGSISFR